MKRCSFQTLSKIYYILTKNSDGLFDDEIGFDVRMKNFNQVMDFLKYKLTMVIPIIKKST